MAKLNLLLAAALTCGVGLTAFAQNAISAKAGLVQVADGEVFVNNTAIEHKVAQFTDLKSSDVLTTEDGRAEVLLTPGAFLRITAGSGVRMVSTRLSDVRMEMVKGEAIIEVAELLTDNTITMTVGTASFELRKGGIYRFDAEPGRMRVFQGEAIATQGDKVVNVKAGKEFTSDGKNWAMGHFDTKETDALYRWSSRRSGNIAVANVSAARQAGYGYGGGYSGFANSGLYGGQYGMGGSWMFNPYFGMYTFMPFADTAWSPFGYAYYTPVTVVPVYAYAPRQPSAPVAPVAPGKGAPPRQPGPPSGTMPGRVTPAFTSSAALHAGAVTRGAAFGHTGGFSGGGRSFSQSSYGGSPSFGNSGGSVTSAPSSSVSVTSSAPARSGGGGGGGGGAASGGGGGGGRPR